MKETNEVGYLFDRYAATKPEEYVYIEPYNKFSIEKDGKQLQLFIEESDGKYTPINYITIHPNNSTWDLGSSEGICNTNTDVCLEYGVK